MMMDRSLLMETKPRKWRCRISERRPRDDAKCLNKMKMLQFLSTCLICFWSCVVSAQSEKPTMKAVVVHEYGGPEVLKYEEVPRPEPKDNEVLVRMIAAGVNPVDALIRSGKYAKFFGTTLPLIPGYDIAAVVEKAVAKVSKAKGGDPIYAYVMWGGG